MPGAPAAPVISDVLHDGCLACWTAPDNDGGSPVTGYHLERRTVGSARWLRVNKDALGDLETRVGDLVEDNDYEFHVAAENKAGVGEFSSPSQPFTATDPWKKPGKPGRPEVSDATGSSLKLTWSAPEEDGNAEITNYVIEVRRSGSKKWEVYKVDGPIASTEYTVTSLAEATEYDFRVAAENQAGVGPFSKPSKDGRTLIGEILLT